LVQYIDQMAQSDILICRKGGCLEVDKRE